MNHRAFKQEIQNYFRKNRRDFSWRPPLLKLRKGQADPYKILISEIMLQQTQTYRVEPKYQAFIKKFPNFRALAAASTSEVLFAWQGLGYNRRALYLKKIAEIVMTKYKGTLPRDLEVLRELPGIGPNTAGSITTFAFNKPVIFIETNIRRVFIHFFFSKKQHVHDRDILPLIGETLDIHNPREWYFALMDYGSMLTKKVVNPNRRSKHYSVQSKFSGSDRQARGLILKILLTGPQKTSVLVKESGRDPETMRKILTALKREGFILKSGHSWRLAV